MSITWAEEGGCLTNANRTRVRTGNEPGIRFCAINRRKGVGKPFYTNLFLVTEGTQGWLLVVNDSWQLLNWVWTSRKLFLLVEHNIILTMSGIIMKMSCFDDELMIIPHHGMFTEVNILFFVCCLYHQLWLDFWFFLTMLKNLRRYEFIKCVGSHFLIIPFFYNNEP